FVPTIPVFRDHSPYVRADVEVAPPGDVAPSRFQAVVPSLRELTTAAISVALPPTMPPMVDSERWKASAASVLLNRTLAQMPRQVWSEDSTTIAARYRALL